MKIIQESSDGLTTISAPSYDKYGTTVDNTKIVYLYPVWVAKETTVTMQTFNATNYAAYNSAPIGTVIALEDTRDNDVYAVAKLADGKWWMIENLRLDDSATITTANTHNPLNNAGNVTLKIKYYNNVIADHLASSSDNWCITTEASCYDQTMLNANNTNIGGKNSSDADLIQSYGLDSDTAQWYGYGNYYNWYSATAGNGIYSFKTNNNSVTGDLCPTNWRLPIGGQHTVNTTGDFYVLTKILMSGIEPNQEYGGGYSYRGTVNNVDLGYKAAIMLNTFPNNFVYSGNYNLNKSVSKNTAAYYWTSTSGNGIGTYILNIDYNNKIVSPGTDSAGRPFGFSVRCIAQ